MRGEYLPVNVLVSSHPGSPPLARGIQIWKMCYYCSIGITPACAGNTRLFHLKRDMARDHPRLRGEYRLSLIFSVLFLGSPPLARGIPDTESYLESVRGITPACAGNTLKKSLIYNLFPISISKFHLVSQTPEML